MDSWLPHYFSAAGVPTNADECLEADQSNLAGHSARFLRYVAHVSFFRA